MIFLKGVVLGVSLAAPFGPINLLIMQRTLSQGWRAGVVAGLGASTSDLIYGCIAAFGLAAVSAYFDVYRQLIQLAGALLLIGFGTAMFRAKIEITDRPVTPKDLWKIYLSTFLLAIASPLTLGLFLAAVAAIELPDGGAYHSATLFVLGVFSGAMIWDVCLTGAATVLKRKLSWRALRLINSTAGLIIISFGVIVFASALKR